MHHPTTTVSLSVLVRNSTQERCVVCVFMCLCAHTVAVAILGVMVNFLGPIHGMREWNLLAKVKKFKIGLHG